ncbi:MAG: hypothetical protein F4X62_02040 [Caldilineaceae bacterium SB0662_bin_25]|nr:hypothetical protein [Caldilineaceae bacterium SB0662_bin_25]
MKNELLQPVIFNVITIVALLFSLFQIVTGTSGRLIRTADAIHALEELAADGVLEDDSIVSGLSTNRDQRTRLDNYLIVTMIIAILANVVANYLGRGRHHANTSRIRELEAELRALRED